MRIGQGWDIHRLEAGRNLVIGGVRIDSDTGAVAHSDGDVLVHALIDALLGSICEGDIGKHFPDTDQKWKGADSIMLLAETIKILNNRGCRLVNIDSTVILQKPKLSPYINMMREKIAETVGLPPESVSVKAKTNEKLDSVGAGDAVEAQAVVLIEEK